MGRLDGKIAAITGAGDGIGRAAALRFASEGAEVIILEVNESSGTKTQADILAAGGAALFIRTDVSDLHSVRCAFDTIEKTYGALHVLYNNASVFYGKRDGAVAELEPEVWAKVLSINLNGLFHCCKCAIPLMKKSGGGSSMGGDPRIPAPHPSGGGKGGDSEIATHRGGSIINTSSSAGVIGIPGCDAYTASKGATVSLTKSMAVEYGPVGIRVNCIAPAAIRTDMVRESNLDNPDFDEAAFLRTTPVRRWGVPEDVASLAVFLASDESAYINGAVIVADGGITIT